MVFRKRSLMVEKKRVGKDAGGSPKERHAFAQAGCI